jgi:DNA-binding MarR family transcriptional regulator
MQQYNVLRILRGAGGNGLPTLSIVERMIENAPGITRLIDRLEKKGLVRRVRRRRTAVRSCAASLRGASPT